MGKIINTIKNYKHRNLLLIIGCILMLSLIISFSYAYFIYSDIQEGQHIGETKCFKLNFVEENNIELRNAIPVEDIEGITFTPYTFTITNVCDLASSYYVTLEDLVESDIDLGGIRYQLNDEMPQTLGNIVANGNHVLDNTKSSRTLASGILLKDESITYNLKLWVDINSTKEQTAEKIFKSKIVIVSNWNKEPYWHLTLDYNGGVVEDEDLLVVKGRKVSDLPTPTREDYTFLGWYDSDDNEIDENSILNSDVTIYAKWKSLFINVTLVNAKFSDNTTSKVIRADENVTINAVIPSNYTESSYSGKTSCSSASDVGNIKYQVRHDYSLERWSVLDTTNTQIVYKIPGENNNLTIEAVIKDTQTQTNKQECYQTSRSYSSGYYYCSSGHTLSGSTCSYTTTSGYTAPYYSCNSGDSRSGTTCTHTTTSGYTAPHYSCNAGDSLSGTTCTHSYAATYHAAYYSCPYGGTASGSECSYSLPIINDDCDGITGGGWYYNRRLSNGTIISCTQYYPATYNGAYYTCGSTVTASSTCSSTYSATYHAASCSSGTVSGSACKRTYSAYYSSGYYYCSVGTMSGDYCYSTRSIS